MRNSARSPRRLGALLDNVFILGVAALGGTAALAQPVLVEIAAR